MHNTTGLRKNTLGLASLVFFVVAAASPLTGVAGGLPVAIFVGQNPGIPLIYILACLMLALFSVGYLTMSRYVQDAGAFYTFIAKGLGKNWGASASATALLAYCSVQMAVVAMLGFFSQQFISRHFSLAVPWWVLSMLSIVLVWILGIRRVEVGGRILGVLMLGEVAIVLLTDVMLLLKKTGPLDFSSLHPSALTQGSFGITFMFSIASFIGFESTAIYAEECRDPQKTVPRATLCAMLIITAFFCFTSFSLLQAGDFGQLVTLARQDPGNLFFSVTRQVVGPWAVETMSVLLITSLFAAAMAFHNTISRYLFSISRDGLIWRGLCRIHPVNGTPHRASHLHSVVFLMLLAAMGTAAVDPVGQIFAFGSAVATLSVLLLQVGVSAAVVAFFRQRSHGYPAWQVCWAPLLALLAMAATLLLVIANLSLLSGSDSPWVQLIPWCIALCALAGYAASRRQHLNVA